MSLLALDKEALIVIFFELTFRNCMQYSKSVLTLCMALMGALGSAHASVRAVSQSNETVKMQKATLQSKLPTRKDGLWEVTVRSDDLILKRAGQASQPATVRQCTSAESEPIMLMSIVPGQEDCHSVRVKPRLGKGESTAGYDIHTVCYVHGNRVNTQMALNGDLRSSYNGTFRTEFPQTPLNNTGRMVYEGRWLGPCREGQRPGDMELPNGVTVNIIDDRKRAKSHESLGHKH